MKYKIHLILFIIVLSIFICGCTQNDSEQKIDFSNYETELKRDSRTFKSEVFPNTEAEKLVLDFLKVSINDNYDDLKNLNYNYPDSDISELKDAFKNGKYTESLIIHSIEQIEKKDYESKDTSSPLSYPNMDKLKKYKPYKFEMIQVKYTQKLSEKSIGVQYNDGDYLRCFVVTKESKDSQWKIYDNFGAY